MEIAHPLKAGEGNLSTYDNKIFKMDRRRMLKTQNLGALHLLKNTVLLENYPTHTSIPKNFATEFVAKDSGALARTILRLPAFHPLRKLARRWSWDRRE